MHFQSPQIFPIDVPLSTLILCLLRRGDSLASVNVAIAAVINRARALCSQTVLDLIIFFAEGRGQKSGSGAKPRPPEADAF